MTAVKDVLSTAAVCTALAGAVGAMTACALYVYTTVVGPAFSAIAAYTPSLPA